MAYLFSIIGSEFPGAFASVVHPTYLRFKSCLVGMLTDTMRMCEESHKVLCEVIYVRNLANTLSVYI